MIVKSTFRFAVFALFIAMGLAALPINAQQVDKSITINRDGKVGDQPLAKGSYTIKFTEDKDGELVILKGKKEIAKAPYELTKLNEPARENAVAYTLGSDGSYQIKRIEFKGKNTAIEFKGNTAQVGK
ncbi:MAG TPA: hypothetical protein VF131_15360 [Blastocatellia bacterium]|nr:hypothetical protein [Blastocatellia bacterium]